jgi:hypothetical protein
LIVELSVKVSGPSLSHWPDLQGHIAARFLLIPQGGKFGEVSDRFGVHIAEHIVFFQAGFCGSDVWGTTIVNRPSFSPRPTADISPSFSICLNYAFSHRAVLGLL